MASPPRSYGATTDTRPVNTAEYERLLGDAVSGIERTEALGHTTLLAQSQWPAANAALAQDDEIEIGVQVNGKLRDTIKLERDCPNDVAEKLALASVSVQRYLDGKTPKKVIVVQNRIINVVA